MIHQPLPIHQCIKACYLTIFIAPASNYYLYFGIVARVFVFLHFSAQLSYLNVKSNQNCRSADDRRKHDRSTEARGGDDDGPWLGFPGTVSPSSPPLRFYEIPDKWTPLHGAIDEKPTAINSSAVMAPSYKRDPGGWQVQINGNPDRCIACVWTQIMAQISTLATSEDCINSSSYRRRHSAKYLIGLSKLIDKVRGI